MEVGQTVAGRYRLRDRLGSGGMSVVWRAEDAVLGREVAIKVLSGAEPAELYAEARAAARLRHPNVVEVYDYGETAGLPYVVMELVEGRSLSTLLTGGPLPWRPAVLIAAQVAAALAAAHERGVVHRDVKPANVMVTASRVKLVDFGISAAVGERDSDPGLILGTPAYLAPERLAGGVVRPATDVYALGLLLYLMVAGRLPWRASTTTQMLRAHVYQEPAPLPAVPDLPEEVARLCRRCLAKQPGDRPSAAEAARVLGAAAGLPPESSPLAMLTAGDGPTVRLTSPAVLPEKSRAGRRAAVAALAVSLVAAPAVAWWLTRPSPHHAPAAAATTPAAAPIRCTVQYAVQDVADGRTSTALTLVNDGAAAVTRWHLDFRLPTGQQLIRGSNAHWQQDGANVRADGTGLAPGRPLMTTFEASYRDTTTLPAAFTLNGVACRSDLSLAGRTTPPAATQSTATQSTATQSTATQPAAGGDDNQGKGKGKGNGGGKGKG
jgi:hypothetical protein